MGEDLHVEDRSDVAELSVFQKIIGVFTSPARTFASITAKPSWLVPVLIMSAVNLTFIFSARDVILNETLIQQEEAMLEKGMDEEQIDQALGATEKFMKYLSPVSAVVFPFIVLLIVAGVYLFVGNVILGGSAKYKQVLSVTAYSWLILSLYGLVILPIVLAKETMLVTFSAAIVMPVEDKTTFLYQLLSKVDIFYAWWIAVYSIGLATLYKMKTQKVAIAVVTVYVLYALVSASLTGMFA